MSKKVYIGESNLMDIKNAMASNNVSHSIFMPENTPPYEKDEFEIGGEGGNNDFFHVNEDLSQDLIKFALEQRPDKYSTWAVINPDAPGQIPFYAEKKSRAIEFKRWYGKGVIVNLSKYENLNEHHSDQRLPFDDDRVSRKRYIEQYIDWLEEFGKYGELPDGTLDYWEEIAKAIKEIREAKLHGRYDNSLPESKTDEEVLNDLKTNLMGPYIGIVNGKVFVERTVNTYYSPTSFDNIGKKDDRFYDELIRAYNDNVGGCWCYEEGGSNSYCGDEGDNYKIVLYGQIRTDDIDFVKTVQLNYHYPDEHEIRVKPFAKIELEGFLYSSRWHSFDKHLIVSATYSGNNAKFSGEFGKIDDGFGHIKIVDRNRNVIDIDNMTDTLEKFLEDNENLGKVLNNRVNKYNLNSLFITKNYYCITFSIFGKGKCNFYDIVGRKFLSDKWFDKIVADKNYATIKYEFYNGIVEVVDNLKYNFFSVFKKRLLSDEWFSFAGTINSSGIVVVRHNDSTFDYFEVFGGKELTNQHFKNATFSDKDGFGYAEKDGKWFTIDKDGNMYEGFPKNEKENVYENIEAEVEASEVKLDSFKKNDTLAPRIWDGFDLNPRARLKLLDIADDFWDFVNITWVKRKGIHLTGSICNFNWSKFSDIDLHLVVDFSEIDERKDFVQEYFDAKKNEWNNEHSNLKIFGYPVELYVEDVNAETASGGLYDLEENDWIKKPSPNGIKSIGLDKYEIKNKSADLMTKIDDLYDAFKATNDDAELREIGRKAHKLRDKIKKMRKFGLNRGGESDSFNIIYKVLRRAGYMDMLWDLSSELYDKLNSIDEIKDDKTAGIILEYLESNHNLPLYKYFEWAKNATDEDKARDLMQQCSDTAVKYLETRNACMCDDLAKLRIEFRKNNDVIYDEDFVDAFARGIAKNGLLRDLDFFMRYRGDFYELPSWMTMEFNRIVKNEWCIHFCFDAYSIAREGFKWGTDDIGRLALTGAGLKKPAEGYNFAFPIGERHIDRNTYGSFNPVTRERGNQEAVIFQTSGVEVYHEGDEQNQVVFWGPNAKNFIPIKYDIEVGDWCIYGNKGQVLKNGSPSEILNWVLDNLPQYRKQIMVGKNGVNLKETIDYFDLAKERFGVTYDIRECGYILPDGSMLDFSGRHMITGDTDSSHLKGRRSVDHRDISDLNWDKELKNRTNTNINMSDFIKKGAIRVHCSNTWSSINLFVKPTKEQINPLLRLIQYSKGNVTVEIGDGDNSYEYAEWDEANPRRVINDVIRYFDGETTNLVGNVTENKVITAYFNKYINLNEEIVADGSPDHNPFKKRWKHEREVLKDYIVNYGEIMTSKENGKEYKVLYDTMLSSRLGINYCICIQWDSMTMEPGNVIYVRAFDKFTRRRFKPEFDTRGRDNLEGTYDDLA